MSVLKPGIEERVAEVRSRIEKACLEAGRKPEEVKLLAVSKTFPAEAALAAAQLGLLSLGENYAQEGCDKVNHPELSLEWHFIGPLQSNKTRPVAEHFSWVQSVNRMKIAERLSSQRPEGMPPLNVLIEVNVDGEETKSGVKPEEALQFARDVAALPNLKLRGFMVIPTPEEDPEKLFDEANAAGLGLDTLSMGMSSDIESAIQCGSTMVRVGSAIFGPRDYGHGH